MAVKQVEIMDVPAADVAALEHEVQVLQHLSHRNIVRCVLTCWLMRLWIVWYVCASLQQRYARVRPRAMKGLACLARVTAACLHSLPACHTHGNTNPSIFRHSSHTVLVHHAMFMLCCMEADTSARSARGLPCLFFWSTALAAQCDKCLRSLGLSMKRCVFH